MNRVENKVCIVTGGALGIGRACVERLGEEGAKVAVFDLLDAEADALVAELHGRGTKRATGTSMSPANRT